MVVVGIGDDLDGKGVGLGSGFWTVHAEKFVGVIAAIGLVQVVVDGNTVVLASLRSVIDCAVNSSQTVDGDEASVACSSNCSSMVTAALARLALMNERRNMIFKV